MGGFHPVAAAERRGHADRAALIAADGHVDLARAHQRAGARGGAARRIAMLVGVVDRAGGVGVRASREAEILAMRLVHDRRARVEQAGDDRGVDIGRVTLEGRRAVHHRHARDAHIVLDRDGLALQRAARGAPDLGFDIPRVHRVFFRRGAVAGGAGVEHGWQVIG